VVGFVLSGQTVRQAAAVFGVGVSSAVKWSQRQRATGSVSPKPMGGRRRDAMAVGRDYALARLAEHPSLSLRALQAELAEHGIKVSYGALWSFVHSEGLSFKKKRAGQRDRAPAGGGAASPLAAASGAD
jgi:transposase